MEIPARATIATWVRKWARPLPFSGRCTGKEISGCTGRPEAYTELLPDEDAEYDETIDINLSELEPLIACPHQPDNVMPLHQAEKEESTAGIYRKLYQCKLCRYCKKQHLYLRDIMNEDVSCTCAVSSKQVYRQLMRDGYVEMLLDAGVRLWRLPVVRAAQSVRLRRPTVWQSAPQP